MEINTLTELIIKAAYQVHDELGTGYAEKVYENAMVIALGDLDLKVAQQVPLKVRFRGKIVGDYIADIIVLDTVVVELKTVGALISEHQAQLINYLKATRMNTGLLVNFAKKRLEIKRAFSNFH